MDVLEICREALEAVVYRPGEAAQHKALEALAAIRAARKAQATENQEAMLCK